uniref:Uncharacterized protein n=3 Tax=Brassica TaxID=3705 RepID=A0A0D3BE12_BRAOL|nr:unnamed protein product [Brassica oleracea]
MGFLILPKQRSNILMEQGLEKKDFQLRRYWQRKYDRTYVNLYHSLFHKKCPPHQRYPFNSGGVL